MRPGISRWLSGLLASVLVVLAVAIVWGTMLAAAAAVLSAAVFAYLFVPPDTRFEPADWRDTAALGVFLVTAVAVGGLAARLRHAAVEQHRLSEEQAALRRVATLVARGALPHRRISRWPAATRPARSSAG